MNSTTAKKEKLHHLIANGGIPAVAYSGGTDSSLLLLLCHQIYGHKALGFYISTPFQSKTEKTAALLTAKKHGWQVQTIMAPAFQEEGICKNAKNRCYLCKTIICQSISEAAKKNKCSVIYDGSNADDEKDFRPGRQALKEAGVKSPLSEAGFTKAEVRAYGKELGLLNWEQPSKPCLLTRFPYEMATPITLEMLRQIDNSEAILAKYCNDNFRLRWEGASYLRLEASRRDLKNLVDYGDNLVEALKKLGVKRLTLDLTPFCSGSFDRQEKEEQ